MLIYFKELLIKICMIFNKNYIVIFNSFIYISIQRILDIQKLFWVHHPKGGNLNSSLWS
jgi:hypothetical protein